jgi:hypothetical protein
MSAARSTRTGAAKPSTTRPKGKATAGTGGRAASSAKPKKPGAKSRAASAKASPAKASTAKARAADPDGLVRTAAGRYTSADERFTVESDASGTWYVIDQVQKDDFGLPRLLGPHRTLAAARQAIRFARGK